ncbi:MAG: M48 family metallopeptidase [Candidatus Micrarchaeia archaeon]
MDVAEIDEKEIIEINNEVYYIIKERTNISHARAIIKDNNIIIKFPTYYVDKQINDAYANLKKRVIKVIIKDPERFKIKKFNFYNGEILEDVFNNKYIINVKEEKIKNIRAFISQSGTILIKLPADIDESKKEYYTTKLAIRLLSKKLLPKLEDRINFLNNKYFNSKINKILIRNNSSNWGTYNQKTHNIGINFKLLFTNLPILDSVIIHELAHTKIHNHSKNFWNIVYSIVPDYKEKRKWLIKNQNKIFQK